MRPIAGLLLILGSCRATPEREAFPDLDPLIERLDSDDIDVRENAVKELVAFGERALPEIEKALARTRSPEAAARLRSARGYLRGVQLDLRFERTRIPNGGGFSWNARLVNRKMLPVVLVRPLGGSGSYRQYPMVDMEVRLSDGSVLTGRRFDYERSGAVEPPCEADLLELASGESLELFERSNRYECRVLWFDSWAPPSGRYRARLVYDSTPTDWVTWATDEPKELGGPDRAPSPSPAPSPPDPSMVLRFARVHHARIFSDWVDLVVE
jgi:hypothetical protein